MYSASYASKAPLKHVGYDAKCENDIETNKLNFHIEFDVVFRYEKKVATRHKSLERKCETEVWERKNSIKRSNEKLEKRRIKRVGIIPLYRCDKGTLNDYYTSDSNNKFHIRWRIGKRYQNAFEKCLDFFVVLLQLVCHLNWCSNRRNYMILVMVKGFCGRSNNDTHSHATKSNPHIEQAHTVLQRTTKFPLIAAKQTHGHTITQLGCLCVHFHHSLAIHLFKFGNWTRSIIHVPHMNTSLHRKFSWRIATHVYHTLTQSLLIISCHFYSSWFFVLFPIAFRYTPNPTINYSTQSIYNR